MRRAVELTAWDWAWPGLTLQEVHKVDGWKETNLQPDAQILPVIRFVIGSTR